MKLHFRWGVDLSSVKRRWKYMKLCFISLTYNSYSSASEVLFEPIITLVDFAARWFGIAFVTLVTVLVTYVVVIYYMVAIPHLKATYSPLRAYATIAYGHYLLIMIVFHYYKGVTTHPGRPPKDASERAVTSVCKKCILPKPPRTHHCSVCRNCILKMDHHCPWLNNCVGHFNHRYFISFCVFMWLGTVFVMTTTWPLFHDCFDVPAKLRYSIDSVYGFFGKSATADEIAPVEGDLNRRALSFQVAGVTKKRFELFSHEVPVKMEPKREGAFATEATLHLCVGKDRSYRTNVVFLWLLCTGVTVALGALTAIQFRLISRGETSIEKLINDKECRKAAKNGIVFYNPYHLGFIGNWKMILGFRDCKSFVTKVLVPQTSLPAGDGLVWDSYINKNYASAHRLHQY